VGVKEFLVPLNKEVHCALSHSPHGILSILNTDDDLCFIGHD